VKNDKDISSRPLIAIVPGVTGDINKLYMISLIKASIINGYDIVVINYRGMAGVPLKVCS
jgi:predicted alpha/beta-fold hydrolase